MDGLANLNNVECLSFNLLRSTYCTECLSFHIKADPYGVQLFASLARDPGIGQNYCMTYRTVRQPCAPAYCSLTRTLVQPSRLGKRRGSEYLSQIEGRTRYRNLPRKRERLRKDHFRHPTSFNSLCPRSANDEDEQRNGRAAPYGSLSFMNHDLESRLAIASLWMMFGGT